MYKQKSDSYLMKMTKTEIISELRVAEHNFFAMEEALDNSAKAGMKNAEELKEARRLLKAAVEDFKFLANQACEKNCNCCPLDTDDYCEWKHEKEALKLIGGNEND